MEFAFSAEQDAFRKSVRDWASSRLAPGYLARAQSDVFPTEEYAALAEMGLLGLLAPEDAGGQGADYVTAGIAAEEVAYADFNCAFLVLAGAIARESLWEIGTDVSRDIARRVVSGDAIVAAALTEPEAGSDLARVRTTARRVPGGWSLRGEKSSISLALVADAALVLARLEDDAGSAIFLVPLDDRRVTRQSFADPGFRPIGRGALAFDDVVVSDDSRLGADGRGFQAIMRMFDFTRPALGLMCIGAAQASMDDAGEYAKTRVAFGRPIARHQGVAFPIAEHDTMLRAARWICFEALWRRDAGLPHTKEAAAAKWLAPRASFDAAHEALLLHGNVGYTTEAPFCQRMLDIMSLELGDGTAQIQKSIIAREILGREFRPY